MPRPFISTRTCTCGDSFTIKEVGVACAPARGVLILYSCADSAEDSAMDDKEQSSTRSQTDKNEIDADANNGAKGTFLSRLYKFYVLVAMMLVYLINQMDRFVLGVGSQDITRELQFGQNTCHPILSKHNTSNGSCHDQCSSLSNQTL